MTMNKLILVLAASLALSAALAGCGESESATETDTASTSASLPAGLMLDASPGDARGVAAVRKSASDGNQVIVAGVVGGRADPIADGRAIFTLLDDAIPTCDEMSMDDGCTTPWDACCEPQETITAHVASVQVVDDDGRPLELGLAGAGGIAPGDRVTVVGTFEPSPDGAAATINATGIHVAE